MNDFSKGLIALVTLSAILVGMLYGAYRLGQNQVTDAVAWQYIAQQESQKFQNAVKVANEQIAACRAQLEEALGQDDSQ